MISGTDHKPGISCSLTPSLISFPFWGGGVSGHIWQRNLTLGYARFTSVGNFISFAKFKTCTA